ncbi:putative transcriptional regulator, Crp/Fnr family [Desulfovibrio sp. X2]|uniref:cyclic nucleotide-binding domain-containing protein n=1 Tax=Desulfovibrio sp. X2 TaxID=941449 RepID=UPI000358A717|nr:cyclic nucleotide-binding domain-containing protein [Desulfovibrio sp. X2]EPR38719.1 putative transcriptional regulator, Crp/Fnr family [Desulfovibrio sp. X2]
MIDPDHLLEHPHDQAGYLDKLRLLPGFDVLDDERLRCLLSATKVRRYEPGEMIIREGESSPRFYFLLQGLVRVFKGAVELGCLQRLGEVFGEMGVIDKSPRSASVQAIQRTLCLVLDAEALDGQQGEFKAALGAMVYKAFAERLVERLRETTDENVRLKEALARQGLALP